jgi:hypothetical protein
VHTSQRYCCRSEVDVAVRWSLLCHCAVNVLPLRCHCSALTSRWCHCGATVDIVHCGATVVIVHCGATVVALRPPWCYWSLKRHRGASKVTVTHALWRSLCCHCGRSETIVVLLWSLKRHCGVSKVTLERVTLVPLCSLGVTMVPLWSLWCH